MDELPNIQRPRYLMKPGHNPDRSGLQGARVLSIRLVESESDRIRPPVYSYANILPFNERGAAPPPTPGDIESPIPTDLILEGRQVIEDALARGTPRRDLRRNQRKTNMGAA